MTINPYDPNPLADLARAEDAVRYEQVAAVVPPSKMFAGGTSDVPAFTASGIDPQLLLRLPYRVRHAAAATPDVQIVHAMFERYATDSGDAMIRHDGLDDAQLRMDQWLHNTDTDTRTPEQRAADDDAEYLRYYSIDSDRSSYTVEQQRRAREGEEPLADFAELVEARRRAQQWAANGGGR